MLEHDLCDQIFNEYPLPEIMTVVASENWRVASQGTFAKSMTLWIGGRESQGVFFVTFMGLEIYINVEWIENKERKEERKRYTLRAVERTNGNKRTEKRKSAAGS